MILMRFTREINGIVDRVAFSVAKLFTGILVLHNNSPVQGNGGGKALLIIRISKISCLANGAHPV